MDGSGHDDRLGRPLLVALGGCLALTAAMGIGRFVYTPILPFMTAELGLSKAEGGFIASASFLGYLIGALLASSSALPGGRRGWFLGGLAISGLSTGAMAMFGSLAPFLILRFTGGMASAFVLVFASTLVLGRLAKAERPNLSAVHFAGVGTGIAVSAVLVALGMSRRNRLMAVPPLIAKSGALATAARQRIRSSI